MAHSLEILAPAGDMDMLRAAVLSGADAVYLGLTEFSARRSAGNFTIAALREAVAFCHARNVRVHVAVNTTLYPGELARVAEALQAVDEAGADALIVQDLGVAALARRYAPHTALHASTQMSIHSLAGARAAAALGFSRVILARELSLAEIRDIAAHCGIETEVFVHGALCMSVSGQCYLSAFLGGRSGNRGACAGPCRLPFCACADGGGAECGHIAAARAGGRENAAAQAGKSAAAQAGKSAAAAHTRPARSTYHLSLKDMSLLHALPQLQAAGVRSVKIEGRLRTPEYCAAAVNACLAELEEGAYDEKLLRDVFSRSGFTDAYLTGHAGGEMFGVRTEADAAAARAALPQLHELYRRERPRVPVTLALSLTAGELCVTAADDDGRTVTARRAAAPQPAQKDPEQSYRRALEKTGGTPFYARAVQLLAGTEQFVPAGEVAEARREALAQLLALRGQPGRLPAAEGLTPPAEPSEQTPEAGQIAPAQRHVQPETAGTARKTAQTDQITAPQPHIQAEQTAAAARIAAAADAAANAAAGLFCPASDAAAPGADALSFAGEPLPGEPARRTAVHCSMEDVEKERGEPAPVRRTAVRLAAQFAALAQMPPAARACDALILPLAEWSAVPAELRARTWLALPRAVFGTAEQTAAALVEQSKGQGFAGYFVQNLAHFALCAGQPLFGGFGLNITNGLAAQEAVRLGLGEVTLSPELLLRDAARIAPAGARTALLVYGYLPLMLTRACPLQNVRGCAGCSGCGTLTDRKGISFAVRCTAPGFAGVRTVYNSVPLYLGDRRGEVCADTALLSFTTESAARAAQVLALYQSGAAFDGPCTRGLYYRGTSF